MPAGRDMAVTLPYRRTAVPLLPAQQAAIGCQYAREEANYDDDGRCAVRTCDLCSVLSAALDLGLGARQRQRRSKPSGLDTTPFTSLYPPSWLMLARC